MASINNGVLDGVRRTGAKVRDLAIDGQIGGAPMGLRIRGATSGGAPLVGTWKAGDVVIDKANGIVYICTAGGTGPGATWSAGSGSVNSVTAADTSVVIAGTSSAPTVRTNTLDVIAADHPPAANWSNNSHKITALANGSASTDAAAWGQTVSGVLTTAGDLVIENATPAPARLAVGTAGPPSQVLGVSSGLPAWINANLTGIFGDSSDGAVTLNGSTTYNSWSTLVGSTYTMTRDVYATNFTINNSVTLAPAGYKIFCQGTFTNNGTVTVAGGNGTAAGNAGSGGGGSGTVMGGRGGGAGGTAAGTGGSTTNAAGLNTAGVGGTGTGGVGGAAGTAGSSGISWFKHPYAVLAGITNVTGTNTGIQGGPGGGGGGGDGTNKGGGGGAGGGVVVILAWQASNGSGAIVATGGNGGTPTTGNCGGGGGGSGGLILVYTLIAWTAGTANVSGGTAGSPSGTGTNNAGAGSTGTVLNQVLS